MCKGDLFLENTELCVLWEKERKGNKINEKGEKKGENNKEKIDEKGEEKGEKEKIINEKGKAKKRTKERGK